MSAPCLAVRREVFAAIGGFDPAWDGTEEYDLALRLAERAGAEGFGHVADVLYHRLTLSGRSRRPIEAICADMTRIVQAHLDRLGIAATAEQGVPAHTCRVRYRHDGPDPLVSIIVPTKNQLALLKRCVETVLKITEYENYEVIVVDNGSDEADACAYLQAIEDKYPISAAASGYCAIRGRSIFRRSTTTRSARRRRASTSAC